MRERSCHDTRNIDALRADRSRPAGAGGVQKPRAEADDLCALARGAFEALHAGDAVLPAGPSGRADRRAGAARGVPGADRAGHPTARTGGTAANTRAASHAGTGKPGGEAADGHADLPDHLVQRQRAARPLDAWLVAGLYDPAAQKPEIPRKTRKNQYLRLKPHPVALPCRPHPGRLSDAERAAERHDRADPAPRADAPAASRPAVVVLPDGRCGRVLVESAGLARRDRLQARCRAGVRRGRRRGAPRQRAHCLRKGDPGPSPAQGRSPEPCRAAGQRAHFVPHEKAAHERPVRRSGPDPRRVRDRLLLCRADAAEIWGDHSARSGRGDRPVRGCGRGSHRPAGRTGAGPAAAASQRRDL